MDPLTKEHNIKYFKIESLFNDRTIEIPFDTNFKIFIGENGIGKTTILNALYYTLTGKFSKLRQLEFKAITIEFNTGKKVEIEKDDLTLLDDEERLRFRHEAKIFNLISQNLSEYEREMISELIRKDNFKSDREFIEISRRLENKLNYPPHIIRRALITSFSGKLAKLEDARLTIINEIDAEILYFPTYRRIEEELSKLGTLDEVKIPHDDTRLIQFGMEDVTITLNKVIDSIKNSAILGFSEITGEMLSEYLDNKPGVNNEMKIVPEILNIILERVGTNISQSNKNRIIELVKTNEILDNENYTYLFNFLSKLTKIYDQQKDVDNSIKTFETTCNGYLTGKKIVYNESKVTINVISEKKKTPIQLINLSSGEKQIISLFTKIFFNEHKNIIVLFDEPELSLSMEWQKKLLPDVLKSQKCKLLLSVTHSPFIFDNDLDIYAEDMSKYVQA